MMRLCCFSRGHYEKDLETIPVKRLIEEPFIVDIETAPLLQKQLKNARMTFTSSVHSHYVHSKSQMLGVSLLPLEATKVQTRYCDVHHPGDFPYIVMSLLHIV